MIGIIVVFITNLWRSLANGWRRLLRRRVDYVRIELSGALPEFAAAPPWWQRRFLGAREPASLHGLRRKLQRIAADPQVSGVLLKIDGLAAGWATLQSLREGRQVPYIGARGLGDFDLALSYTGGRCLDQMRSELGARRVATLYGHVDPQVHTPVAPARSRSIPGEQSCAALYSWFRRSCLPPERRAPSPKLDATPRHSPRQRRRQQPLPRARRRR